MSDPRRCDDALTDAADMAMRVAPDHHCAAWEQR